MALQYGVDLTWCWMEFYVHCRNQFVLSQSYEVKNKSKAQAFNEFFVFSCVTITALLSGWLESTVGWQNLNLYVLPFVLLVMAIFIVKTNNNSESQIA